MPLIDSFSLFIIFHRCLGIKSPFIEFMAEYETISDVSVSLNLSDKNPDSRHRKNSLHNLGNFINPIGRDEKTAGFKGINKTKFSIQSDLLDAKDSRRHQEQQLYELQQQQIQELQQQNLNKSATNKILMDIIKPIVTDIHKSEDDEYAPNSSTNINNSNNNDHPTIQIIANANSHYEQMEDSRHKVIMPLALKTTLIERERSIPTPMPTPKPPQSNIEDLKNHLLMLKNYSEVDKSFQSKFVVFKKPTTTTTTEMPITTSPVTSTTTTTVRTTTMQFPMTIGTMYRTKPSINMPNVQNSQILRDVSYPYTRVERVTIVPQVFLQNDQQQPDTEEEKRQRTMDERRKNQKNEKKMKRERKKNKNNNKQQPSNMIPTTTTAVPLRSMRREQRQRQLLMRSYGSNNNNNSQVLIGTTSEPYIINLNNPNINQNDNNRKLSRAIRSKSNRRRNNNKNKMQRDILMPIESAKNDTSERIDLNPKYCYDVSGMSKGQQKLCEQFTGIMPAISRGARAAIQVRFYYMCNYL